MRQIFTCLAYVLSCFDFGTRKTDQFAVLRGLLTHYYRISTEWHWCASHNLHRFAAFNRFRIMTTGEHFRHYTVAIAFKIITAQRIAIHR
ncbi:Uncharacterised protein [Vibrio cholerae]|uniref:Uncharacterized protein n=1 Tax=Vibrio cholerae TaxID=666 RepID=A0A655XWE8_VIBCL|nr:Uncharacterised protein [Vibrio cholerae]CSC36591.1 Uncharacterised protein [Vibrio cholerae]